MIRFKKIVIAAGTGQIGKALVKHFSETSEEIIILSRRAHAKSGNVKTVNWNGRDVGNWSVELEGADLLINLAGTSVNCRHTPENKKRILDSRIDALNTLAKAVELCKTPPSVWIQASAGALYKAGHEPSNENDFTNGTGFMADVCRGWEAAFNPALSNVKNVRKVILRIGIVLGKNEGAFPKLRRFAKLGLGGKAGNGKQMISWIHEDDVALMVEWIVAQKTISGPVNCCAPEPVSNKTFMKLLRNQLHVPIGFPAPAFVLRMAAVFMNTEASLVLDSMWMHPEKILQSGFKFKYGKPVDALMNLLQ